MLDSHCDFEFDLTHDLDLQAWTFKVNFGNSCILGTAESINMERKEYESIGCYTHYMTLSYDFDLGF